MDLKQDLSKYILSAAGAPLKCVSTAVSGDTISIVCFEALAQSSGLSVALNGKTFKVTVASCSPGSGATPMFQAVLKTDEKVNFINEFRFAGLLNKKVENVFAKK